MTEENTACCYALQDKVWVEDPDGNSWEVFVVKGDVAVMEKQTQALAAACRRSKVAWRRRPVAAAVDWLAGQTHVILYAAMLAVTADDRSRQ